MRSLRATSRGETGRCESQVRHTVTNHSYVCGHVQEAAERAAFVKAARAARAVAEGKPGAVSWYGGPHGERIRALEALALEQAKDSAARALALNTLLVCWSLPYVVSPTCLVPVVQESAPSLGLV